MEAKLKGRIPNVQFSSPDKVTRFLTKWWKSSSGIGENGSFSRRANFTKLLHFWNKKTKVVVKKAERFYDRKTISLFVQPSGESRSISVVVTYSLVTLTQLTKPEPSASIDDLERTDDFPRSNIPCNWFLQDISSCDSGCWVICCHFFNAVGIIGTFCSGLTRSPVACATDSICRLYPWVMSSSHEKAGRHEKSGP